MSGVIASTSPVIISLRALKIFRVTLVHFRFVITFAKKSQGVKFGKNCTWQPNIATLIYYILRYHFWGCYDIGISYRSLKIVTSLNALSVNVHFRCTCLGCAAIAAEQID